MDDFEFTRPSFEHGKRCFFRYMRAKFARLLASLVRANLAQRDGFVDLGISGNDDCLIELK